MSLSDVMQPASPEASALAAIIETSLWVGVGAFVLAMVVLAGALLWQKRRPVAEGWWIWGGGLVLPALVFGGLLAWSMGRSEGLDDVAPAGSLQVTVTGRMWWWDLRYAEDGGLPAFASANELRVPAGRTVRLTLASGDVIHSLWVPSLNGKMDLVPGRLNRLSFTASTPGVYRGPCAEYCGTQHAGMVLQVVAMAPEDFDAWRRRQAQPSQPPAPAAQPLSLRGADLFRDRGCAACHTVRGRSEVAAEGLGPDLTGVTQRLWLGAGVLRQSSGREALKRWITDAQAIKPGARMPTFRHLPAQEIDALAAFLEDGP
ncbi:cytochrome c oxidase subunit 2 [Roseateles sp. YR242]|uniref:cytochrome c oxidase subunit II n=1 Tax=Roseateles sp. YR242 TaxID=1855305 RepID=UPI0008B408B6|nr:cytochrome c oxidase subunit II [Roseateles sp. YR242]SEL18262.1 cytochrome c oxidase subunit 2 [Roseateles sp. YR242]